MAGGGGRGREDGIDPVIITKGGIITKTPRPFIIRYQATGGMIIGKAIGADSNGMSSRFPMRESKKTGINGRKINIGKKIRHGACRDYALATILINKLEIPIEEILEIIEKVKLCGCYAFDTHFINNTLHPVDI
jgi:hypothetical protein